MWEAQKPEPHWMVPFAHPLTHCCTVGHLLVTTPSDDEQRRNYATVPLVLHVLHLRQSHYKGRCHCLTSRASGGQCVSVCMCVWEREQKRSFCIWATLRVSRVCAPWGNSGDVKAAWEYLSAYVLKIGLLFVWYGNVIHTFWPIWESNRRSSGMWAFVHANVCVSPVRGINIRETAEVRTNPGLFPWARPRTDRQLFTCYFPMDPNSDPGSLPRSVTVCWPPPGCSSWAMGTHTHTHTFLVFLGA